MITVIQDEERGKSFSYDLLKENEEFFILHRHMGANMNITLVVENALSLPSFLRDLVSVVLVYRCERKTKEGIFYVYDEYMSIPSITFVCPGGRVGTMEFLSRF